MSRSLSKIALIFLILESLSFINSINGQNSVSFNQIGCTFDTISNFCNWDPLKTQYNSNWTWPQDNTRRMEFTGSLGPVNNIGRFIQIFNPTRQSFSSANGALQSPLISPTTTPMCFSFYYYIHGVDANKIELYLLPQTAQTGSTLIWARHYPAGDMWHRKVVNIPAQNSLFKLKFMIYSGGGAIALDNFIPIAGPCQMSQVCDFESGSCGWNLDPPIIGNSFAFKIVQAMSSAAGSDEIDHSTETGYGHFVEASNGKNGDVATITSNQLSASFGAQCLQFWYWRHLSTLNMIDVSLQSLNGMRSIVWRSDMTFPKKTWHRASVTLQFYGIQKIVIRATHLAQMTSPIDIDDISLKPLACPPVINCDFNIDMCGWSRDSTTRWIWDHGFGRVEDSRPMKYSWPPRDRTSQTLGMFMYTDFSRMNPSSSQTMKLDSEFVPPTSGSCFSFYYYTLTFDDTKNSFNIVLTDNLGQNITNVWKYSHSTDPNFNRTPGYKYWFQVNVPIQSRKPFRISLQVTSTNASTYLALDDITYRAGACGPSAVTVKPTLMTIPPALDLGCNFDSITFCNWKNDATNQWNLNNINLALLPMMPNVDHSKQSIYGRYGYVIHSNVNFGQQRSAYMTAVDNANYKGGICVSLWYYMRTNAYAHFNVTIKNPQTMVSQTVSRFNDHGEKWNLLRFDSNEQMSGYQFSISAMVSNGIVAIDDIQVTHQPCGQLKTNVFQCTFEEGHTCNFTPAYSNTKASWQLYVGYQTFIKTFDHTMKTLSGHYFALDFSNLSGGGVSYNYRVVSQNFPPTKGSCVTFSYYMRGLTQNEVLNFYIKKENVGSLNILSPLWYARGEMGPFWYSHRMTINSTLNWQIVFGAVAVGTRDGLIAIDDVMVEIDKSCPMKGRCDFENGDTCMWESILPTQTAITQQQKLRWSNISIGLTAQNNILMKTDFTWTVHSPQHGYSNYYPFSDHTLNQRTGSYLLLRAETPRRMGDRAVLMSDRYDLDPKNRAFCLKFWYFLKNTAYYYVVSRLEVFQSENYKTAKKIAQISSYNSNPSWIPFNITVRPDNMSSTNMWFYLAGTVGTPGSYIAVDDISIDSGECVVPSQMFNCSTTEWVLRSKVCDYVRDCSNGMDEQICGSCDFKNGQICGYKYLHNGNSQVNTIYQWRFGNYMTGPKVGPDGLSGYMIAIRQRPGVAYGMDQITSPQIHGAASGCYVYFRYNLFGNRTTATGLTPAIRLSVILDRGGFEQTEIWNSDVLNIIQGRWLYGYAYLRRMNYDFSLTFRANDLGYTTSSYVGLSNIQLQGCRLPPKSQYCNPTYGFKCTNGACISIYSMCDFSDDCGDNSDEMSCTNFKYRCDFENGFCNWGQNRRDKWFLTNGATSLTYGPTRDHTKGFGRGRIMSLRSFSPITPTQSTIDGPIFQPSQGCYMTFWLDMEGNTTGGGFVSILAQNLVTNQVSVIYKTLPYQFPMKTFGYAKHVVQFTGLTNKFRVLITGQLSEYGKSTAPNYIAIDDISFSPQCVQPTVISTGTPPPLMTVTPYCKIGEFACKNSHQCIDKTLVCNFINDCTDQSDELNCGTCNFNAGSMCGWTNIGNGKQQWSVQPASKFGFKSVPKVDGAGSPAGSFLIIDTSRGGTYNLPAVISTPILGATGPNCRMTFAYHQSYPVVGSQVSFRVNLHRPSGFAWNKQIFQITQVANYWMSYSVQIGSLPAGYQIQISGMGVPIANTLPYADMEIDEIKFINCVQNSVVNNSLTCNFENGFCGWFDVNLNTNNQIDWVRTRSGQIDPGYDHTSQIRPRPTQSGYWIYTRRMPGLIGNNTATLMSVQAQPASGPKCLTFWYHMFGRDPANFTLETNSLNSIFGGKKLWIKQLPQSNNWLRAQVTIQSQTSYYLMFRASLVANSKDVIGLDDISFTDGACPDAQECDFEVDFCGWNNANNDFVRQTPSAVPLKFPPIDHTLGTNTGNYIKVLNTNRVVHLSKIITKVTSLNNNMPSQPQPKCIKFWYYFSGTQDVNNYLHISTLKSNTILNTVWSRNTLILSQSALSQQWLYGRVNFMAALNDKIQIDAQITNQNSIIAIDDVLLQTQSCEPPGWCDFESDFCGWTNAEPKTNRKRVLWTRNQGETESDKSGPSEDHTTGTDDGWYVYVPLDSQSNGVAVLQSELLLNYGTTVCLRFFYHMLAETLLLSPKLIVMYSASNLAIPHWIQNITAHRYDRWNNFNVTLNNMPPNFRLILKTVEGNTSRADVAVDDIQVKSGRCEVAFATTPKPPPTNPPVPVTERQWDCDFETNCNWAIDTNWNRTWWWTNSSQYGPRVDHTYKNAIGHYLLYVPKPNAPNPATLTSKTITTAGNSLHCFSFWYYVDSESYFNFSIGYKYQSNPNNVYFLYYGSPTMVTNSWKLVNTQIPISSNIQLVIRFFHNNPFVGGFALDDLKLTPGICSSLYGSSCSFETGYCGYQAQRLAPNTNNLIGLIYTPKSGSYNIPLPQKDHTTGGSLGKYFLFANKPTDPVGFYRTQLIINNLPSTGIRGSCLKFWYQINSNFSSSFYVFVAPLNRYTYLNPEWVATYPHYTTWTMGQLTVNAPYDHKIILSFVQNKNNNNNNDYLAVDDISVTNGVCEPPVSCDFDTDSCSWHNVLSLVSNYNWGRFTGPPPVNSPWPGPRFDHTYNRFGGSYLYITAYRTIGNRDRYSVMESMPVISQMNTTKCFSFFTQLLGIDTSIQVFIIKYGKNINPQNQIQSLSITNGTKAIWTKVNVNINPILLKNTTEFSIRIRGKINNPKSFIALDDVKLTDGVCKDSAQNLFYCTDGTQLNISQVCNFVKDCPQSNDDELNCGACDFEKDSCGWANRVTTGEQWIRKSAVNQSFPVGPNIDGKNNPKGYYLIINPRYKGSYLTIASVQSYSNGINQIKIAYQTCKMSFRYYIKATATAYFNVRIRTGFSSYNIIWRLRGDQGSQWKTANVSLNEQRSRFAIEFIGYYPGEVGIIAIDDINFQNCAPPVATKTGCQPNQMLCPLNKVCINKNLLCDGVDDCGDAWDENALNCQKMMVPKCTFDIRTSFCNWTKEKDQGSNAVWNYVSSAGPTSTQYRSGTGPITDHTFRRMSVGSFLLLSGQPKDYGKKSRLITPMVKANIAQTCALRFFYYMFGDNSQMGSLSVYQRYANQSIKVNVLFTKSGNQDQQWFRAVVPVTDQTPFQFVIEGQVGKGNLADIAIDDVSFSVGCIKSTQKPFTTTTSKPIFPPKTGGPNTGPKTGKTNPGITIKPTKSSVGNSSPNKAGPNTGGIVAGVLVPILVIGVIVGIWYYRRYHMHRHDEDRIAFTNAAYGLPNIAESSIDETHDNVIQLKKRDKHHEHENHDKH